MTAITTPRLKESSDSLLRFAMRADAVRPGSQVSPAFPSQAGWPRSRAPPCAFEYAMSAFFIAYGVVRFRACRSAVGAKPGIAVITANVLYTVAAVVFVLADWMPLTTLGVVLTLATGVYTLVFAELQYQGLRRMKA